MKDVELNKAALLIAKLLIRTREGKVAWTKETTAYPVDAKYVAHLEDGIEAVIIRASRARTFKLEEPDEKDSQSDAQHQKEILSVSLFPSLSSNGDPTPESIVYDDLEELIQLAENPKFISNDRRYLQALTYLDKLTA